MTDTPNNEEPSAERPGTLRRAGRRIARILGIERSSERRLGVRLRLRFFVFGGFFLLLLGSGGLAVYSTSPSFCRSCHIMEPYYQAWADSKHNGVACVECHYPPDENIVWKKFQALSQVAKYVTRTYSSKPYAEVPDSSCLRSGCHSTRLLQGKLVTQSGIHFDHKPHLEGVRYGRELRCVSCHSQIVVGKHIEVTYDTCYLCHLKDRRKGREIAALGGCVACHDLPERDIKVGNLTYNHKQFLMHSQISCENCHQDVVQGNGEVDKDRCLTCHNQPEKIARFGETDFIHQNHVTKHNTACFHCHREIRHGARTAGTKEMSLDCNLCHSGLHTEQRSFYMGLGARGVELMPSPMYLANVDCVGCHLEDRPAGHELGHTLTGCEKGCTECHGEQYVGTLAETHKIADGALRALEVKLEAVRKGLPEGWHKKEGEKGFRKDLEDVAFNLGYLERAHPVHNLYYAAKVITEADSKLDAIAREFDIDVKKGAEQTMVTGAYCATLCHVRVGVKVPPDKVEYEGKEMPHKLHSEEEGMPCSMCHVFGGHKDVRLKEKLRCVLCHEKEEEEEK